MKVVAFVGEPQAGRPASPFMDGDWRDPVPERPRDLLVRVHAVSVNPRDLKSRKAFPASPEAPLVLGYDASGVVEGGRAGGHAVPARRRRLLCRRARPAGAPTPPSSLSTSGSWGANRPRSITAPRRRCPW